jgi:hypothetical protein
LQIFTSKDSAELTEQAQRVLNVDDVLEVAIDVASELSLDARYINVELYEITVEGVVSVIKQRVVDLASERVNVNVESVDDGLDFLKVVLFQGLELSNCAKQINKLSNTTAEKFEFSEDICLAEVELTGLGHALEALLREIVLLDVGIFECLTALEHHD